MKHNVAPLDAHDDSFRCSCSRIFRSSAGWAICPEAIIKGFVRRFNAQWFYYVKADTAILYRGNTDTWQESFDRAYRHVVALRPAPVTMNFTTGEVSWPSHTITSTY